MPFTFSYLPEQKKVLLIEGVRESWKPEPVAVLRHRLPFLDTLGCEGMVLANAFSVRNIPYHWKKGRLESWNGNP
jgi:hypothetical protein